MFLVVGCNLAPRSHKMAKDCPKMAPRWPKRPQDVPKTTPRCPKMAARCLKMPLLAQDAPKMHKTYVFPRFLPGFASNPPRPDRLPATPLPAPSPIVAYAFRNKLQRAHRSLSVIRHGTEDR